MSMWHSVIWQWYTIGKADTCWFHIPFHVEVVAGVNGNYSRERPEINTRIRSESVESLIYGTISRNMGLKQETGYWTMLKGDVGSQKACRVMVKNDDTWICAWVKYLKWMSEMV